LTVFCASSGDVGKSGLDILSRRWPSLAAMLLELILNAGFQSRTKEKKVGETDRVKELMGTTWSKWHLGKLVGHEKLRPAAEQRVRRAGSL
jgi:hypothetical protein